MKTILITGGAGFVGANLSHRLLNEGHNIVCIDNFYTGRWDNIKDISNHPNFKYIRHNITKEFPILDLPSKIDEIYNLASPASPPAYQKDPLFTINTNVNGIKNVLGLALRYKAKLLQASTSEIYGDPMVHPQVENYWGNVNTIGPRSCYDEGKRIAETYCYLYGLEYDIDYKLIRIFNTYGPLMDPNDGRVVSNFINQALNNEDITIYGNGSQTRSFQYVDDLVEGMIRVMNTDSNFHGPVNLGNPDEFMISELATLVLEMIPESTSKVVMKPYPQDDPTRRKPDISLANKTLNWSPKVKLKKGLIKTIKYFKKINQKTPVV